jgi:site-specific DNA recombinase
VLRNLNEARLNGARFAFLSAELFGPDRAGYWRRCLDTAAEPEAVASAADRMKDVNAEIADVERRLDRQLINLEADDVSPALRRRVSQRVTQLETRSPDTGSASTNWRPKPRSSHPKPLTWQACSTSC